MKRRRGLAGPFAKRSPRPVPRRLVVERCEERVLMATFPVTVNADSGPNSLRDAIIAANASPDPQNFITFSLTTAQPIAPLTPLPAITGSNLEINGAIPGGKVEINGTNPNLAAGNGLTVLASNVSIRNLVINSFRGNGISLNGSGNAVTGSFIGTDITGAVLRGNTGNGILVNTASNAIGLPGSPDGPNVITGNTLAQVSLAQPAARTSIQNNFIGTNAAGTAALGVATNRPNGIEVASANNTIGGLGLGAGNLISGNNYGISMAAATATGNLIRNNLIGTNLAGTAAIANIQYGIYISGATNNTIGGSRISGATNVISGNTLAGIFAQTGASGTFISGNQIGVTASGAPLGNLGGGISLTNTTGVTIGSSQFPSDNPSQGNTIAFNTGIGVTVNGGQSAGILSNSIHSNTGLGISLTNNGNANIAAPLLNTAQTTTTTTRITGSFAGTANTTYRLQFFSNKTLTPSGKDGQTYLGFLDVTPAITGNFNFVYQFPGLVDLGDQITATVTQQPQLVNNSSPFSSSQFVVQSQDPDLVVTATATPNPARLGLPLTFQIQVTNSGRSPAFNVVLSDRIPDNTTFVSSDGNSTYSAATRTVTRAINFLAVGQTVTVNIVVRPDVAGATITNVASATTSSLESNTLNNVATTNVFVTDVADLAIFLTPTATLVPVQSRLTYVATLVNIGPSIARNAVTSIRLPASMTDVQITVNGGTFTPPDANNVVTITTQNIGSPFSIPITISGRVTQVGSIVATASVVETTGEFDPNDPNNGVNNNTATATVTVANSSDLSVAVIPSKDPVLIGEALLYTVVVTNNGPSAAAAPVLTDVLPAGLTFDLAGSSTNSGTLAFDGTTVRVAMDPLGPGASATVLLSVRPTIAGPVTNAVAVDNPGDIDTVASNNTASATVLVNPSDVAVAIQGPADPLSVNVPAVYTILVTNNGPADAPGVVLTDILGPGATILEAQVPQGTFTLAGNTLIVDLGIVPAGQTVAIQLTVNPTASGVVANSAVAATSGFDPVTANNAAAATNLASPADLSVAVANAGTPVLIGQPTTFTVTVTNNGPATATGVVVSDLLPSNATLVSATVSQGTLSGVGTLAASLGSLAPGASAILSITVIPTAIGPVANLAAVTAASFDPNAANNTSSITVAAFNQPGTLVLDPASVAVSEEAGSVTFTVVRILGTLGAVSIDYATANLSGVAGVNYAATSGTLTLADGQTSGQITIPILDDNIIQGNVDFRLALSNPLGGATLAPQSSAVVTVINTDRDSIPPQVLSVRPIGTRQGITGFVVAFDDTMDPSRVANLDNYRISFSSRDPGRRSGLSVAISGVSYDPATRTATLFTDGPLPTNRFFEVLLNGTAGLPLADTSGNAIAGGNYETLIGQGTNLRYVDARGNLVTLSLTKGGTMDVIRDEAGNAASVNLSGIVPRRSTLSGSVKRSKNGGGRVVIGTITGLQRFGDVRSNLTTAPFFATFAPVTVNGNVLSNSASSSSAATAANRVLGRANVTLKAKVLEARATPRGPVSV